MRDDEQSAMKSGRVFQARGPATANARSVTKCCTSRYRYQLGRCMKMMTAVDVVERLRQQAEWLLVGSVALNCSTLWAIKSGNFSIRLGDICTVGKWIHPVAVGRSRWRSGTPSTGMHCKQTPPLACLWVNTIDRFRVSQLFCRWSHHLEFTSLGYSKQFYHILLSPPT